MKHFYSFLLLLLSANSFANGNYPELTVAPRASERLQTEIQHESKWSDYLPLQVAGATTLLAGLSSLGSYDEKQDAEGIGPKLAVAVGASWLAASFYIQRMRPYTHAHHSFKNLPYQNAREQLTAERMAEEAIDAEARFAKKIKWMAFGTNLAASAYALSSAEKDSVGKGVSAVALLTSTLPLLFPMRAEQVSESQQSYKKKVFGPITFSNGLLLDPSKAKPTFGLLVSSQF